MLAGRSILLVISGGIAAYKALELIRLLRKDGAQVRAVLTEGAKHFVTPLSVAALTESPVYDDLWSLKDEAEMGHIRLSREADLIVVAPASADRIARMAQGLALDLADAVYLAADKPVLLAPAMNWRMWQHPATQRNLATLRADGVHVLHPDVGPMACGETGPGRLPEPQAILDAITALLDNPSVGPDLIRASASLSHAGEEAPSRIKSGTTRTGMTAPLATRHAVVTAGPTHEPIDPVRYLANRSSGRQGFAIAAALAEAGARVTLIAGPVDLPTPPGVTRVDVVTARDMAAAVDAALPADIAVMVAAVADWGIEPAPEKLKKADGAPAIAFVPNPDILAAIAAPGPRRPALVIGFAAETENLETHAAEKLTRKGADWIIANDVSGDVMGGHHNAIALVTHAGVEWWDRMPKEEVARRIALRIAGAAELEGTRP